MTRTTPSSEEKETGSPPSDLGVRTDAAEDLDLLAPARAVPTGLAFGFCLLILTFFFGLDIMGVLTRSKSTSLWKG